MPVSLASDNKLVKFLDVRTVLIIWLLLMHKNVLAESDWQLVRDKQGIQIYSQPVAGSDLNAVRGVTRVQSSLEKIVTLIRDPALRSRWDEFCGESYLYKILTPSEELVYLHSKLPWPVSDRDMLNKVSWSQDPDSLVVTMRSLAMSNMLPEKKGRVRVVVASNDWQLTPLLDGQVEITTIAHLDPAGPLPAWLLNRLSVDAPYKFLANLRELAADDSIALQDHEFLSKSDGRKDNE